MRGERSRRERRGRRDAYVEVSRRALSKVGLAIGCLCGALTLLPAQIGAFHGWQSCQSERAPWRMMCVWMNWYRVRVEWFDAFTGKELAEVG
jgi:hypothetical protein